MRSPYTGTKVRIQVNIRYAVAFFLALTGAVDSVNDAKGQESVSAATEKGESITVLRKNIDITIVNRQSLYDEMLGTYNKQLEAKDLYKICLEKVNSVQCWQMYGDDIKQSKQSFPYALRSIVHDPLYLVIRFPAVGIGLRQSEKGKKDFVVCLNPSVPYGYWQDINRFKPILKSIPDASSTDPNEILKGKVCNAYAVW